MQFLFYNIHVIAVLPFYHHKCLYQPLQITGPNCPKTCPIPKCVQLVAIGCHGNKYAPPILSKPEGILALIFGQAGKKSIFYWEMVQ